MTRRDLKIASFANRLAEMFPNWTTSEAVHAATRLIENSEQMAFQMDVEAWLAELPLVSQ